MASKAIIMNLNVLRGGLDLCPETVLFDVVHQAYLGGSMSLLARELAHFPTFSRLLRVRDKRATLHKMVQAVSEVSNNVPNIVSQAFSAEVSRLLVPGGAGG